MIDGPHALDLNATLERMEPGIAPVDPMISLASLAISARAIHSELTTLHGDLIDIRNAIITTSPSSPLSGISTNLSYLSILADMKKQLETIVKGLSDGKPHSY